MLSDIPDVKTGYIVMDPYRKPGNIAGKFLLAFLVVCSVICFSLGEPLAIVFDGFLSLLMLPILINGMWANTRYFLSPKGVALISGNLFSKKRERQFSWDEIIDIYPNDMVFKILHEEHIEQYLEFRKGKVSIAPKKRKYLSAWVKEENAICIPWSEEALLYVKKYWDKNAGQENPN